MKNNLPTFILTALFLLATFYWFEWRPASIRSSCMEQSVPANAINQLDWSPEKDVFELGNLLYQNCIRLHGLLE